MQPTQQPQQQQQQQFKCCSETWFCANLLRALLRGLMPQQQQQQ
jgi:hypothetical protein